ncbi:MAG TPA: hypothetical protein EYP98_07490 [Planctomycetes bacterium]|nr:hypothetical protein [Planctomycetota bacterium]
MLGADLLPPNGAHFVRDAGASGLFAPVVANGFLDAVLDIPLVTLLDDVEPRTAEVPGQPLLNRAHCVEVARLGQSQQRRRVLVLAELDGLIGGYLAPTRWQIDLVGAIEVLERR